MRAASVKFAVLLLQLRMVLTIWLCVQGLDIGPVSLKNFQAELQRCKTVIWNGPMGVFEMEAFAKGTFSIATTLATLTNKVCSCRLPILSLFKVWVEQQGLHAEDC